MLAFANCEQSRDTKQNAIEIQNLHGVLKCAEVANLCAEHKVTQLRIRQKDDEEHDGKTTNIFGTLVRKINGIKTTRRAPQSQVIR